MGHISRVWGRCPTRVVAGRVGPGGIQARGTDSADLGHCMSARVRRLTHSRPAQSAQGTRSPSSPALYDVQLRTATVEVPSSHLIVCVLGEMVSS